MSQRRRGVALLLLLLLIACGCVLVSWYAPGLLNPSP
jgi:hypothetical protein